MLEIQNVRAHSPGLWYVVRVKANADRKVAQGLTGRGFEVFLPMQRRMGARNRRIETPLFPGYVFAQFDGRAALSVLMCPGVLHILCRGNVPEPVDPIEMHALQSISRVASSVEPLSTFTSGQTVRIIGGPLADVEGLVLRDGGGQRLVVSISLLKRSVAAEVEREWVEHLDQPRQIGYWSQTGT